MRSTATGVLPTIGESSRQVVRLLLRHGPMARSELARRLSLSRGALTKIATPLLEIGLLREGDGLVRTSPGRRSHPLSVDPGWCSFAGVKLTGQSCHVVVTDLSGAVTDHAEASLPGTDVDAVCTVILDQVNHLTPHRRPARIGVGVAGAVLRARGHIVDSPFLGWRDLDFGELLAGRSACPVSVENDLRALTVAQHWSAGPVASLATVTFGAGVGCGLILDHRLLVGPGGVSGAVNHLRIRDDGPICHRGHRGCVSGFATTAAILAAVHDHAEVRDLAAVADLAARGDRVARAVLADAGYAMGCLIGTICNVTNPERVVLAGEGAALFDLLDAPLHRGIAEVLHPTVPPVRLDVRPLPFTEWARGAALVAIDDHLTR